MGLLLRGVSKSFGFPLDKQNSYLLYFCIANGNTHYYKQLYIHRRLSFPMKGKSYEERL